jgi:predicted PurR-regulated permease PerM
MNIKTLAYFFIVAIGTVITLIHGKPILIPLIFALLLWFIVIEIKYLMNKVSFIDQKVPEWIKSTVSFLIILSTVMGISTVISSSVEKLTNSFSAYESNINIIVEQTNQYLNLDIGELIKSQTGEIKFSKEIRSAFMSVTSLVSSTFLVFIYCAFIFIEQTFFRNKLKNVFSTEERYKRANNILQRIEHSIAQYLSIKTLTSLMTGVLSFIALWIIGIDAPVFWAFLIFLLNYIPSIGSLIGTLFPVLFSILQFGDFTPGLLILLFVGAIQVLIGNGLEPKLMGNSMNLSPLVVILALTIWGAIWGVTGAILGVPITVIMVIIFSQFDSTRPVAILLSEKGIIGKDD